MKRTTVLFFVFCSYAVAVEWSLGESPLKTRWADQVSPENALPEYPRPQLVRSEWSNLNGLWEYAIRPRTDQVIPVQCDGPILVPFPVESALSGVTRRVGDDQVVFYRRTFSVPASWTGQHVLLHFGAVDWRATVWVNGTEVGRHEGGYDPFTIDVTDALRTAGEQTLVVRVWDPTDASWQPRGKQVRKPRGIWYTQVTGIWQTVWLEPVGRQHIRRLKITPDLDAHSVAVLVQTEGAAAEASVTVLDGDRQVGEAKGPTDEAIQVMIPNATPWSPDKPHLYDVTVRLTSGAKVLDEVTSYFGLRKVEVRKGKSGFNRLFLNNEPLFHFGLLDQGWWPDGLYTAPTDEALKYDIEVTRQCGFNMCRKHVKVEPARWYYWCDRLGLMVWQDMPSGDKYIGGSDPDLVRSAESQANFDREWKAIIDANYNHPSIVTWVPFNEGWGQSETRRVLAWTKSYDPTRLVDGPSGWADRGTGDLYDKHQYPGPAMFPVESDRASVLGEFGGLGLPVEGSLWQKNRNWGYRTHETRQQLQQNYERVVSGLRPLIAKGLAAAVYTQTTDVESEVNGLMTYDRSMVKMDTGQLAELHAKLHLPPPTITSITPTVRESAVTWRYTFQSPDESWMTPEFDDSAWRTGRAGFGTEGTPGADIGTLWDSSDVWLRRSFDLDVVSEDLQLVVHHDEDADIFLNGELAASLQGYTTDYVYVPIRAKARRALFKGPVVVAIHCHQSSGGQYIDVGLVSVKENLGTVE